MFQKEAHQEKQTVIHSGDKIIVKQEARYKKNISGNVAVVNAGLSLSLGN